MCSTPIFPKRLLGGWVTQWEKAATLSDACSYIIHTNKLITDNYSVNIHLRPSMGKAKQCGNPRISYLRGKDKNNNIPLSLTNIDFHLVYSCTFTVHMYIYHVKNLINILLLKDWFPGYMTGVCFAFVSL